MGQTVYRPLSCKSVEQFVHNQIPAQVLQVNDYSIRTYPCGLNFWLAFCLFSLFFFSLFVCNAVFPTRITLMMFLSFHCLHVPVISEIPYVTVRDT